MSAARQWAAILALALAGCAFDPSGVTVPQRQDARSDGRDAPVADAVERRDAARADGTRRDAARDMPVETPIADGKPADGMATDSAVPTDAPIAPDVSPCAALDCGLGFCCDKGGGFACHSFSDGCKCDPGTGQPCGMFNSACCDQGDGQGNRCRFSPEGCICDVASGNACGALLVCCKKSGSPATRCESSASGCECNLTTHEPCNLFAPNCCNKGDGPRCHVTCSF